MFDKLTNIYSSPSKNMLSSANNNKNKTLSKSNGFSSRTNHAKKWEIFKITQENDFFHKRLLESKSSFNSTTSRFFIKNKSFNKIFSANGKRSSDNNEDPIYDMKAKTNENFFINKTDRKTRFNYPKVSPDKKNEMTTHLSNFNSQIVENKAKNGLDKDKDNKIQSNESVKNNLYTRKAYLQKLCLVNIQFLVENKK